MDACLSIVSFLEVHDLCHLSKVTLSSVLDFIQPDIAGEGCCPKEFARSSKRKIMILKTCQESTPSESCIVRSGTKTSSSLELSKIITD